MNFGQRIKSLDKHSISFASTTGKKLDSDHIHSSDEDCDEGAISDGAISDMLVQPGSSRTSFAESEDKSPITAGVHNVSSENAVESSSEDETEIFSEQGKENADATYEVTISGVRFRARPSSCVFVASLTNSKNENELYESVTNFFKTWGDISVKVLKDEKQRPYSFVQFTNDKDAKKALKEAQGAILDGRPIRCEPARVNRTVYISNKSGLEISYDTIVRVTEEYGELELVIASNDNLDKLNLHSKHNKKSYSWFVQYVFREEAICAYLQFLSSSTFHVEWAENIQLPQGESPVTIEKSSIFVGQLSPQVTEKLFVERFSRHGAIKSHTFIERSNSPFGFIKYEKEVSAARAVERENHAVFLNKTMHVQYKELHPKENKTVNKFSRQPHLVIAHPPVGSNAKIGMRRRYMDNKSRQSGLYPYGIMNYDYNNYIPSQKGSQDSDETLSTSFSKSSKHRKRFSPTSSPSSKSNYSNSLAKSAYSNTSGAASYKGDNMDNDSYKHEIRVHPTNNYSYGYGYKNMGPPPPHPPKSPYFNYAAASNYYFGNETMGYLPPASAANPYYMNMGMYYPPPPPPPPSNNSKFYPVPNNSAVGTPVQAMSSMDPYQKNDDRDLDY